MTDWSDDFKFYAFDDYVTLPRESETWLIKPLVPAGGWVNLYGKPKKARKSYLALGMSWAISSGQARWLGFEVRRKGPVIFLQADTPRPLWQQRMEEIAQGGYDLSNVFCADIKSIPYPFNIAHDEHVLSRMISEVADAAGEFPALIVLDTARKLHTGDENSSQDTTIFMSGFDAACGPDMAKLLISHDKKGSGATFGHKETDEHEPSESVDLMEGARGSTALAGAVDTVIKLTPKGYMWYQGRAVGEERKHLIFSHAYGEMGYMWEEDVSPEEADAMRMFVDYPSASDRSVARMLAKRHEGLDEEKARNIVRRLKSKEKK